MQISVIVLFPGSLSHLSFSGVKAVSIQDASHTPTFSQWVTPLFALDPQETEGIVHCCWIWETYLSPAIAQRISPCLYFVIAVTEGQEDTSKRTLFQWSHDAEVTWSGFTSVDGGCQHLFDAWLSLRITSKLIKVINWRQNTCLLLFMPCFSTIYIFS